MKRIIQSGIQRRYLKYTLLLVLLAIIMAGIGSWSYVSGYMKEAIVEKYDFINEKMGLSLDAMYQQSEQATGDCILSEEIQNSLRQPILTEQEKGALAGYFAYMDLDYVDEYCYVDSYHRVYTKSYTEITYEDVLKSGILDYLGDSYAKTVWFWTEDTLFYSGECSLFIARYVHNVDYETKPGVIILKMNNKIIRDILETEDNIIDSVAVGLVDANGVFQSEYNPDNFVLNDEDREIIKSYLSCGKTGEIIEQYDIDSGILSLYRHDKTGILIYSIVPHAISRKGLYKILSVILCIFILVMLICGFVSIFFARHFSEPIYTISSTMVAFDGRDFGHKLEIHTNTELDQIGDSYNELLGNIERLIYENNAQHEALRLSEINMLTHQIEPHFLYNTLDNIRMLTRMHNSEVASDMLEALSGYLRISLSKGAEMILIDDEILNARYYLNIQKIRMPGQFDYEIICEMKDTKREVIKLILQPVIENAIKYGLDLIDDNRIEIRIWEDEEYDYYEVYNSGTPIPDDVLKQLNKRNFQSIEEMREVIYEQANGYGMVNVLSRLRLNYGNNSSITYEQKEGTICRIRIPKVYDSNDI